MAISHKDRNFLFCALAIKLQFLSQEQVRSIVAVWSKDQQLAIDEYCVANSYLTDIECSALNLAARQLIRENERGDLTGIASAIDGPESQALWHDLEQKQVGITKFFDSTEAEKTGEEPNPREMVGSMKDRFKIERSLAKGGLGEIFVAKDLELNRQVALKTIQRTNQDARSRFILEAEITGQLEHPSIVPVYGMGVDAEQRPYYAMRLVDGRTLLEVIAEYHQESQRHRKDTVAFRKLLTHFVDVCQAIAYAHSRGVLHRDIKPSNVVLGQFGETLVLDWGLAKIQQSAGTAEANQSVASVSTTHSSETQLGVAMGTPAYMSPEQAAGEMDDLDERTDVYGLGATLYTILTGKPPFEPSEDILDAVRRGDFQPPGSVKEGISKGVAAVCKKAMALRKQDRYPSSLDLAKEIERWLADEAVHVLGDNIVDKAHRAYRRNRRLFHATATFLVLAMIASLVATGVLIQKNTDLALRTETARNNYATARELAFDLLELEEKELSKIPGKAQQRYIIANDALKKMKAFYEQEPSDPDVQESYAETLQITCNLYRLVGQVEKAESGFSEAVRILETRLKQVPQDRSVRHKLALTRIDRSVLRLSRGQIKQAQEDANRAAQLAAELIATYPDDTRYMRTQARANLQRAEQMWEVGETDQALHECSMLATTFAELATTKNSIDHDIWNHIDALEILAKCQLERDERDAALEAANKAVDIAETKLRQGQFNDSIFHLVTSLLYRAKTMAALKPTAPEVQNSISKAETMNRQLLVDYPDYTMYKLGLARCMTQKASFLAATGKLDQAVEVLEEPIRVISPIVKRTEKFTYKTELIDALSLRSKLSQADNARSTADLQQAIKLQQDIVDAMPGSVRHAARLEALEARLPKTSKK